jgi:hypothetical protein
LTTLTHSDPTKSPTVVAIREACARLTAGSLRRLKESLFKLQLSLIEDMIVGGINVSKVAAVSHCARAIEAVDVLQVTGRER